MRWDRFFEDLEDQVASEWEAERVALESEAERLRLSKLSLAERLAALASAGVEPAISLTDGSVVRAPVAGMGVDWVLLAPYEAGGGAVLVPVRSIVSLSMDQDELLRSARPAAASGSAIARRAGFGYAVRDLVRRRVGVTLHLVGEHAVSGTIDRAGADHLDIAVHDRGAARRASEVTGFRLVPFAAIAWIAVHASAAG